MFCGRRNDLVDRYDKSVSHNYDHENAALTRPVAIPALFLFHALSPTFEQK